MTVIILDTLTGEKFEDPEFDWDIYWWCEGNGSCDCNRMIMCYGYEDHDTTCLGCNRFLIVDFMGDPEGLERRELLQLMNQGYPQELISKHIP